jgi:hypothetical protein
MFDVEECKRTCITHNYGGFVSWLGMAYFRAQTSQQCADSAMPSYGSTLYVVAQENVEVVVPKCSPLSESESGGSDSDDSLGYDDAEPKPGSKDWPLARADKIHHIHRTRNEERSVSEEKLGNLKELKHLIQRSEATDSEEIQITEEPQIMRAFDSPLSKPEKHVQADRLAMSIQCLVDAETREEKVQCRELLVLEPTKALAVMLGLMSQNRTLKRKATEAMSEAAHAQRKVRKLEKIVKRAATEKVRALRQHAAHEADVSKDLKD